MTCLRTATSRRWRRGIMSSLIVTLGMVAGAVADEHVRMHASGEALPFRHMGPFVSCADGGILAVGSREALVSRDDGATWTSHPLFRDSAAFQARGERALIRTRKGVIVFVFLNERERHYVKTEDPKNHHLPTYVIRSADDGKTWTWYPGGGKDTRRSRLMRPRACFIRTGAWTARPCGAST